MESVCFTLILFHFGLLGREFGKGKLRRVRTATSNPALRDLSVSPAIANHAVDLAYES